MSENQASLLEGNIGSGHCVLNCLVPVSPASIRRLLQLVHKPEHVAHFGRRMPHTETGVSPTYSSPIRLTHKSLDFSPPWDFIFIVLWLFWQDEHFIEYHTLPPVYFSG